MNPLHAFQDIATAVQSARRVVIIGLPASGKTTLATELSHVSGHDIAHTDDEYPSGEGVSEQAYTDMKMAAMMQLDVIMEGVLGYRLLRKCVEHDGEWLPDLVIEVQCSEEARQARYASERPTKDYRRIPAFCKGLHTIQKAWADSDLSKNVRHMVYVTG